MVAENKTKSQGITEVSRLHHLGTATVLQFKNPMAIQFIVAEKLKTDPLACLELRYHSCYV